jgi:serine/threonine-protein kinase
MISPDDPLEDSLLDEGVALFLQDRTAPPFIDWLSRHSERATDLAKCLAEHAALGRWLAPLRQPVHDIPVDQTQPYTRSAPTFAEAPDHLAEYEIGRELGRGGMGVVYQANDLRLKRTVALKMVLPGGLASSGSMQRFRFESKTVAGLDHPNIVPLYSVGESNGLPFFTMKLIEGGSLANRLGRSRSSFPGRPGHHPFSPRGSRGQASEVSARLGTCTAWALSSMSYSPASRQRSVHNGLGRRLRAIRVLMWTATWKPSA